MIFCRLWDGEYMPSALAAMRLYAADLFNWCAACRDYPYTQHPEPQPDFRLREYGRDIRVRVLREFNRSNPGHEIVANSNF